MIDISKIAIVTTVASYDLYKKTVTLFPKDIDCYVIDGTTGMYGINSLCFMFAKFKNYHYDWIIMADEDVFFYDTEALFDLINFMKKNNYAIAGVRDGGVIKHRNHNPLVINTFFSVLNFKKLKNANFDEILKQQMFNEKLYLDSDFSSLLYDFDIKSLKEPYYCFYFWALLNDYKIYYLQTINPVGDDEIGNIVLNHEGRKMLFHSWYARAYNVYEDQTVRINNYLKKFNIYECNQDLKAIKIFRFPFYNWKKRFKNYIKNFIR